MSADRFETLFQATPLIAILRGLEPDQAAPTVRALVDEGFGLIEIPLNSPRPLESIRAAAAAVGERALLGAGTVLDPADVQRIRAAGGGLIVAPNLDARVGAAARDAGVVYCPGVATPSEMFAAIDLGAHALKLFPGEMIGPPVVKALRAVAPSTARLVPVGGVTPDKMAPYLAAGADGFGLGSALFKPGESLDDIRVAARRFVSALGAARAG